jgi:hypothetical protein
MTKINLDKHRREIFDSQQIPLSNIFSAAKPVSGLLTIKDIKANLDKFDDDMCVSMDFDYFSSSDSIYDITITVYKHRLETDEEVIARLDADKKARRMRKQQKEKIKRAEIETLKRLAEKHKIKIELE